jgi:integrase
MIKTCEKDGRITEILDSLTLTCRRSAIRASGQARNTLRLPRPREAHCVPQGCGEIIVRMTVHHPALPPFGVRLHLDTMIRGSRIRARIRWTDPLSRERRNRSVTVDNGTAAQEFFELMRTSSTPAVDPLITLNDYARSIGDRFLRGVDPTSTAGGYRAGLRLRVLPRLGHLRIREITTGLVDRAIDSWDAAYPRSTLKNTIAALTRVLDEAMRDDLVPRIPVRDRAGRRYHQNAELQCARPVPTPDEVARIAEACAAIHKSYGDHVMLSAFFAARSSEVAGRIVGDVDWTSKLVTIERQCFPGAGGLSIKPPKGRRARRVPIIEPLEPVLRRLTMQRERNLPLLRGPRGGVITTAALRNATDWDALVASLGFAGLRRHDLRHAGATWFANAGVPIHVVRHPRARIGRDNTCIPTLTTAHCRTLQNA